MTAARQPFEPLWEKIRHIIVLSLLGIQPHLLHHYTSARPAAEEDSVCFELLGYDILIDETGRPWLLEVSQTPAAAPRLLLKLLQRFLLRRRSAS